MLGLLFSQVILFIAAILLGFAAGWRLFALIAGARARNEARDTDELRRLLTDAQVKRARGS